MEIKVIQDFENYSVSSCGKIFSRGKEMSLQINIDGYYVVNLINNQGNFHRRVNRLVAQAFIPNPDNLPVVHHKDHNKLNNDVSNLEWTTVRQNTLYSVDFQPDKHRSNVELTKEIVIKICELIQEGVRNKEICELVKVNIDAVKHIRSGRSWKDISKNYKLTKSIKAISESTATWVCYRIKDGYSNSQILKMSTCDNLSLSIIKRIRSGQTWAWLSKDIF